MRFEVKKVNIIRIEMKNGFQNQANEPKDSPQVSID